ncbi:MAG: O-antigen ligase domain-containing protein [Sphingobacteriales bacterium]|nr:MAG: O-antigen ligase domain-containing protein [Sphingobacteriales bacterium]
MFKTVAAKLGQPVLFGILFLLTILAGFFAANGAAFVTFGIAGALLCVMVIYNCVFHPLRGYYLVIIVAFFSSFPQRIVNRDIPISTFVEVLILFLFLGAAWKSRGDENSKGNLLKSGITIFVVINALYFVTEFFNPNNTPAGWIFSSKRYAVYLLFFVISYKLINTAERFRYFLKFWLVMSFIAALYGCWQQWVGFFPFELNYLKNDPHEYALLFQGGVIRKFSFLDGVVTFGNLAGSMAVLTTILALTEKNKKRRNKLALVAWILFLGMSYSGTRTTTIMMPAGIALYVLTTLKNKATLMTLFVTIMAVLFVIFAPIDNPTLNRMRSTFDSKDESLNVRTLNRKRIQPYIYDHPMGGGIGASGVEGMRFNPSHPLAGFPPDSGLLKLALDMGWIGLALNILMYMMILYQGIYYYFKMRNEEYKRYVIAIACSLFSVMVTMFAQVSIGQIPNALFFYAVLALMKRLMEFDEKERPTLLHKP